MSRDKFQTLTEPMYYTLLCLREPACGADVMQQVAAMTGGAVRLGPGTLYHLLDEFLEAGYIEKAGGAGRRRRGAPPPRRNYRLTDRGQEALDAEYRRLHHLIAAYRQVYADRCPDKEDVP